MRFTKHGCWEMETVGERESLRCRKSVRDRISVSCSDQSVISSTHLDYVNTHCDRGRGNYVVEIYEKKTAIFLAIKSCGSICALLLIDLKKP